MTKHINELQQAYEKGNPLISDESYDAQYGNNIEAYKEVKDETYVIPHYITMGTCPKTRDESEFNYYVNRLKVSAALLNTKLYFQPKFDGVSGEIILSNGHILSISSRGNGEYGQDLTDLKDTLFTNTTFHSSIRAVYGEFVWLNNNPSQKDRNLVAGYLSKNDHHEEPNLHFIAYRYVGDNSSIPLDLSESMSNLEWSATYEVNDQVDIPNFDEMYPNVKRDGIIVKYVYSHSMKSEMYALKPEPLSAVAEILDVVWKKGKSKFSATAKISKVEIGGVTVQSVTLPLSYIKDMDLMIGDTIMISRRGDVIPCIEYRVERGKNARPIVNLTKCPDCGSSYELYGKKLLCSNEECISYLKDFEKKVIFEMMSKIKGAQTKWLLALSEKEPGYVLENIRRNTILGDTVTRSTQFKEGLLYLNTVKGSVKVMFSLYDIDGLSGKRLDKYVEKGRVSIDDIYIKGIIQQLGNKGINQFADWFMNKKQKED